MTLHLLTISNRSSKFRHTYTRPNIPQQDMIKKTDHTEGTLKTGVELDGVRDTECRDAGVITCGVLLAAHDKICYSQ